MSTRTTDCTLVRQVTHNPLQPPTVFPTNHTIQRCTVQPWLCQCLYRAKILQFSNSSQCILYKFAFVDDLAVPLTHLRCRLISALFLSLLTHLSEMSAIFHIVSSYGTVISVGDEANQLSIDTPSFFCISLDVRKIRNRSIRIERWRRLVHFVVCSCVQILTLKLTSLKTACHVVRQQL